MTRFSFRSSTCSFHDCCVGKNMPLPLLSSSTPDCKSSCHADTTPIPSPDLIACEMTKTRTNSSLSVPWKCEWGSRGVDPLINLITKCNWVANFTSMLPNHLTPRPHTPHLPHQGCKQKAKWAPETCWPCQESNPELSSLQHGHYTSYSIPAPECIMPVHTKNKTTFWHSNLQMFHTVCVTEHVHLRTTQKFFDLLQHLQKPLTYAVVISWLYICNKNWINLVLTDISKPDLCELTCTS